MNSEENLVDSTYTLQLYNCVCLVFTLEFNESSISSGIHFKIRCMVSDNISLGVCNWALLSFGQGNVTSVSNWNLFFSFRYKWILRCINFMWPLRQNLEYYLVDLKFIWENLRPSCINTWNSIIRNCCWRSWFQTSSTRVRVLRVAGRVLRFFANNHRIRKQNDKITHKYFVGCRFTSSNNEFVSFFF